MHDNKITILVKMAVITNKALSQFPMYVYFLKCIHMLDGHFH